MPLAWNLAGGYQDPISKVVSIHMATMEECAQAYVTNSAAIHEEAASATGALGL